MCKNKRWICPNCRVLCAIEIDFNPENIVHCISNHQKDCNYNETVSETKKLLSEQEIINRHTDEMRGKR